MGKSQTGSGQAWGQGRALSGAGWTEEVLQKREGSASPGAHSHSRQLPRRTDVPSRPGVQCEPKAGQLERSEGGLGCSGTSP